MVHLFRRPLFRLTTSRGDTTYFFEKYDAERVRGMYRKKKVLRPIGKKLRLSKPKSIKISKVSEPTSYNYLLAFMNILDNRKITFED